jgi:hypothetical protein
MKTKTLVKSDATNCKAVLKATSVVEENGYSFYLGVVSFKESEKTLFTLNSQIFRLNEDDAIEDARQIALDNGF